MKEQRITDAKRVERIDKLEAQIRLEVDGALHRHLCCKGIDASVSEALELLAEGFAEARTAGEPLEALRAFLAEHGLHVPVANGEARTAPVPYVRRSNNQVSEQIETHIRDLLGRGWKKTAVARALRVNRRVVIRVAREETQRSAAQSAQRASHPPSMIQENPEGR